MKIVDFSKCSYSEKHGMYGGMSGRKDGIIYEGENWIIKFPKSTIGMNNVPISYTTSPLNEYVGSHIYEILGYDVHQTLLGIRDNKLVVACKDFEENARLIEMRTIKNTANSKLADILDRNFASTGSDHFSNIDELLLHIRNNDILNQIPKLEEHFWDMAVVDLFIRNNDRNNGNWGILRNSEGSKIAPVFDNGGCFNDKADDEKLNRLMNENVIIQSSINFRSSFGREMEQGNPNSVKQMNAIDFIEYAMQYDGFKNALIKNVPLIKEHLKDIEEMICDIPKDVFYLHGNLGQEKLFINVCSDVQKEYFIKTMNIRFEKLLEPAYQKVVEQFKASEKEEVVNDVNKDNKTEI